MSDHSSSNNPAATDADNQAKATHNAIAEYPVRGIGPAFMGGRIADIAVDPRRPSTWFVAVGSGGVWKTVNAGTTWTPLFDKETSYSIGCLTLDPSAPDTVWVGTGEAVSGRHVAWGDGVYRSLDGGTTWEHMGLDRSEHIAEILVDPANSNRILVAAEGPLWSSGGERGVYRSLDGGHSWEQVLSISGDTGVTSLVFAPDDPQTVYAAAYQRRRRVWSFLGGGPESGIHKSTDGGTTWRRVSTGLPETDMGKIGLATTAADPDVVYATIEADKATRGFYRSTNRGESWERRNEYLSGGTGPHYYQELYASPTNADRVYQVDVFVHWTNDGGKTINRLESGKTKHADNHVVWIDPTDQDHLIIGADAGLYETYDHGATFRHVPNLPISQFYRVAADNAEPFYNVLAGAQDLGTLFGPSRTRGVEGVRSQDWTVPLGADGYHTAFDPLDPTIGYLEWQNGNVLRWDQGTMELHDIQPQPGPDDPPERWNWDCPIVVSHHDPARIYVASQRVWRSDNRGDAWQPISSDLTRDINRYELATDGQVRSVDALWDHMAMSGYSTISHLDESSLVDGVLYVGTDDGLVQATEDGGTTWRPCGELPEFPADGFVNNVKASWHDPDGVFVVGDAHKNGDYSPYVFESSDRGGSWTSIAGDLPDGVIVWSIEQDHVDPNLLILGAENGIYVSVDRGEHWIRLKAMPTISVRDVKVHRRDGDLIAATFGRGIYIVDDLAPLRNMTATVPAEEAAVLPVRDAWWYVPHQTAQAEGQPTLGSTAYAAPNPDFGALITYYLAADLLSTQKQRQEVEQAASDDGDDVAWPGWDALWDEHVELPPGNYVVIRDSGGQVVRRLEASTKAGLHRLNWDLRRAAPDPIELNKPEFSPPWASDPIGPLVAPGQFSAELVCIEGAVVTSLCEPQLFAVKPVPALDPSQAQEAAAFSAQVWNLQHKVLRARKQLKEAEQRHKQRHADALVDASTTADDLQLLADRRRALADCERRLNGDPLREKLSEARSASISEVVGRIAGHHWLTTSAPTQTQVDALAAATEAFNELEGEISLAD